MSHNNANFYLNSKHQISWRRGKQSLVSHARGLEIDPHPVHIYLHFFFFGGGGGGKVTSVQFLGNSF